MAVTLSVQELGYRLRILADASESLDGAQALVVESVMSAARWQVVQYAPGAPDDIHNEAVTRLAGYLYDSPFTTGPRFMNARDASGATALLAPWRVRRAWAIEDAEESEAEMMYIYPARLAWRDAALLDSTDAALVTALTTAGARESLTGLWTIPASTGARYLAIWRSLVDGGFEAKPQVRIDGGGDAWSLFRDFRELEIEGVLGVVVQSIRPVASADLSGRSLRLVD